MSAPTAPASSPILKALLAANVAVYVLWNSAPDSLLPWVAANFIVSREAVMAGRVWTLLSSCFSHIDPTHLLFNMLALWFAGRAVERVISPKQLLGLYIVGGLLASSGHVLYSLITGTDHGALGASGSVMAILVVFALLFPRVRLLLWFFVPVPASVAVAGFILLDMFGASVGLGGLSGVLYPGASAGIAHAAHLGGAAYGLLYYFWWIRPRLVRVEA